MRISTTITLTDDEKNRVYFTLEGQFKNGKFDSKNALVSIGNDDEKEWWVISLDEFQAISSAFDKILSQPPVKFNPSGISTVPSTRWGATDGS